MLREGPIPLFVHGAIEYLAAVVFIVAPFVLGFVSGAATAASIVVGVAILVVAAVTNSPTGLVKQVPVSVHMVIDFILAGLLIAAPFLFGFSGETAPLAFFIAIGVLHLLITIATRFRPSAAAGTPARSSSGPASPTHPPRS